MGRVIKNSMRSRLQESIMKLQKRYRAALKDTDMQKAFDELWPAWSTEQGAMIYAEVLSSIDLLLLTATVDNRKQIIRLCKENTKLKRQVCKLIGEANTEV